MNPQDFGRRSAAVFVALFLPQVGHAQLAHEPFAYAGGNAVTGSNGGSGWDGAWTQDGETGTVQANGLGWGDGTGRTLVTSDGGMSTAGPATTRNFRIFDAAPVDEAWIAFLWNLSSSNAAFEGVSLYLGANARVTVSNPSNSNTAGLFLGVGSSGSAASGAGTFGVTHLIVLHLRDGVGTAGADVVEMFVDPGLAAEPTSPNAVVEGANLSFDRIRVAAQNGTTLLVDEIRLGATFADVAPSVLDPDADSDGDGVSDTDEALLGTNASISDADLFAAIRRHADYFGFLGPDSAASGEIILPVGPSGLVPLIFDLEHSGDLRTWWPFETIQTDLPIPDGKALLRATFR